MKAILALPGIHLLARRYGWPSLRRRAFDAKYDCGEWRFHHEPPALVELVARHAKGGHVVMLGCGMNPLGMDLPANSYATVRGCDLSHKAITLANDAAPARQSFTVADMMTFTTETAPSVVVLPESIYYLSIDQARALLTRWRASMAPGGVIIITMADPARWAGMVDMFFAYFNLQHHQPITPQGKRTVTILN